jgi:hypothetical protein
MVSLNSLFVLPKPNTRGQPDPASQFNGRNGLYPDIRKTCMEWRIEKPSQLESLLSQLQSTWRLEMFWQWETSTQPANVEEPRASRRCSNPNINRDGRPKPLEWFYFGQPAIIKRRRGWRIMWWNTGEHCGCEVYWRSWVVGMLSESILESVFILGSGNFSVNQVVPIYILCEASPVLYKFTVKLHIDGRR